MDAQVDPRLRSNPNSTSPSHFPALSYPSLTDSPVRLPLPTRSQLPFLGDSPTHSYYQPPLTPTTSNSSSGQASVQPTQADGALDPKRARACEACRGLKVRCDVDPRNPDGACKRCAKAGRSCVVTAPTRKRQKKTDSRVAELEKKIDALTATLQASQSEPHRPSLPPRDIGSQSPAVDARLFSAAPPPNRNASNDMAPPLSPAANRSDAGVGASPQPVPPPRAPSPSTFTIQSLKRKLSEDDRSPASAGGDSYHPTTFPNAAAEKPGEQPPSVHPFLIPKPAWPSPLKPESGNLSANVDAFQYEHADVIDRRIVSSEVATVLFDRYVDEMAPQFPAVVFPPGTAAAEIRKTKPTLFLAILSVGAGPSHPEVQKTLIKEVMKILANRVMCNGEKSLEIVQALHVLTIWYFPPEHYDELKFYQLIHIAAVMAIDLGLGKRLKNHPRPRQSGPGLFRDHPWRRIPLLNPESVESRRTWLTCYFLCANVAMSLRRPNLVRWTSYMGDCVDYLESSPEALKSDRQYCQWIKVQRIAEDVGRALSMDDPSTGLGVTDSKVQDALKVFERQLDEWRAQLPKDLDLPAVQLNAHVLNLYMHEISMHLEHVADEPRGPCHEHGKGPRGQPEPLTPMHVDALTKCLTAIHAIIGVFLSFNVATVRVLPIIHFVRVAYAVVCLTKLYFAAMAPNSELGKVINRDSMKVERHLDCLVDRFRAAAEGDRCKPASKFLVVLLMLKAWFQKPKMASSQKDMVLSLGAPDESCPLNKAFIAAQKPDSSYHSHQSLLSPSSAPTSSTVAAAGIVPVFSHNAATYAPRPQASATVVSPSSHNDASRPPENSGGAFSEYRAANTPLQLLSEVAMGNSNGLVDNGNASGGGGGNVGDSAARFGGNFQAPFPASLHPLAPPTSSSSSKTAAPAASTAGAAAAWYGFGHGSNAASAAIPSSTSSSSSALLPTPASSLEYSNSGAGTAISPSSTSARAASAAAAAGVAEDGAPGAAGGASAMFAGTVSTPLSALFGMTSDMEAAGMGDGFGQAVGLTLGDEDFSSTLLDDIFPYRLYEIMGPTPFAASATPAAAQAPANDRAPNSENDGRVNSAVVTSSSYLPRSSHEAATHSSTLNAIASAASDSAPPTTSSAEASTLPQP